MPGQLHFDGRCAGRPDGVETANSRPENGLSMMVWRPAGFPEEISFA